MSKSAEPYFRHTMRQIDRGANSYLLGVIDGVFHWTDQRDLALCFAGSAAAREMAGRCPFPSAAELSFAPGERV